MLAVLVGADLAHRDHDGGTVLKAFGIAVLLNGITNALVMIRLARPRP